MTYQLCDSKCYWSLILIQNFSMDIGINHILNNTPSLICVPVETTGIRLCWSSTIQHQPFSCPMCWPLLPCCPESTNQGWWGVPAFDTEPLMAQHWKNYIKNIDTFHTLRYATVFSSSAWIIVLYIILILPRRCNAKHKHKLCYILTFQA